MRTAEGVHVEWVEGEAVILSPDSGELHYLNASAALVYALIEEHGYEGAMKELEQRPDFDRIQEELPALLEDLVDRKLLLSD